MNQQQYIIQITEQDIVCRYFEAHAVSETGDISDFGDGNAELTSVISVDALFKN